VLKVTITTKANRQNAPDRMSTSRGNRTIYSRPISTSTIRMIRMIPTMPIPGP
jgi:hypothetical protein